MTGPRVSVVLLTYQQRPFIEEAIASVRAQTYPNVELVCVDNGSTDGTRDVLARYAGDPGVRVLPAFDNTSITKPLNEGIRASTGEYISILYGDDLYLPEKLARQVAVFEGLSGDYGVVHGPGYGLNIDTGERWVGSPFDGSGWVLRSLLLAYPRHVHPISPLIRRACFETHPFREELFVEGESIFLRMAITHRFLYHREPLVVMREHRRNMGKAVRKNTDALLAALVLLERDPLFPPVLRPIIDRTRASALRNLGWWAVRIAEDRELARDAFTRAARLDPRRSVHPRVVAGRLLALLPGTQLHAANRVINSVGRRRVHLEYLPDYPS